jgi:DNA-binding MarR family transcriptional regulator
MHCVTAMPADQPKRRPATEPTERDYELLAAFRHELREFLHFSEHAARAAGIPPQQHQAMLVIRGVPGRDYVTIGELALRLKIRPHSAVELAERMHEGGWVIKSADARDRRRVLIRLTPQGDQALRALSGAHKAELARVGPALKEILTHLNLPS